MNEITQDAYPELLSPQTAEQLERYYYFRWQHLRQPLSFPQGSEQDDLEEQAQHCMALFNNHIIGVGRVHQDAVESAQIRYMAVDPEWRARGVGRAILAQLIRYAHAAGVKYCWCNARDEAIIFYRRCGFKDAGAVTTDLNIPHTRMEYYLD